MRKGEEEEGPDKAKRGKTRQQEVDHPLADLVVLDEVVVLHMGAEEVVWGREDEVTSPVAI